MNAGKWMLVFGFTLVASTAWALFYIIQINEPYPDEDVQAAAIIKNNGHHYDPNPEIPYNAQDLLYVRWSDGTRSLHKNIAALSPGWELLAKWQDGEVPPTNACNANPNVPGCKPTLSYYSNVFQNCPYGCGHSPYLVSWGATNATGYEAQIWHYGWGGLYSGSIGEVLAATGTQYPEDIRVRAVNSFGASEWGYMTLHVQCSETQDPW